MEIRLEGTFNIRDLGGMPIAGGRKVKSKRLIRSDALSNLTPEGEATLLKEYDLANILDLRTESELGEQPPRKIEGATWMHLPLIKGDSAKRSNAQFEVNEAEEQNLSLATIFKISITQMNYDVPKAIIGMYDNLLNSAFSTDQTKKFFDLLLATEIGSTLWHCTAGKDRTGFLTVLVLELLGVSRDLIKEDFLLSEKNLRPQTDKIIEEIEKEESDPRLLEQVRILNGVLPEYMDAVFDGIDAYGGIESYMKRIIGLSGEDIEKFRDMYTEAREG